MRDAASVSECQRGGAERVGPAVLPRLSRAGAAPVPPVATPRDLASSNPRYPELLKASNAPHSEPPTPEISALNRAGLVPHPTTVHARLGARAQLFPHPHAPAPPHPRQRVWYGPRAARELCAPPSATRDHVRGSASHAFVYQQHGTSDPPSASCVSTLTPLPHPSSRLLAPMTRRVPAPTASARLSRTLPWPPFRARHRPRCPPRAPAPQR